MTDLPADLQHQRYDGYCFVCGQSTEFHRAHRSLREGFACTHCRASLRYRGQAEALLELFGDGTNNSLEALNDSGALSRLSVYEPGVSGPFRQRFTGAGSYIQSFFWDDVEPGQRKDGVLCQDLEHLTFRDESFDLVISSDIMEHVRNPLAAFKEIERVLKPGGVHLFSIPVQHPLPARSEPRVDVSGPEDVYLKEPHYHGDGRGGRSLVYTDFGWSMVQDLMSIGMEVICHAPSDEFPEAQRLITFSARRKRQSQAAVLSTKCNVCGADQFKEGPFGRLSLTRKLPTCSRCGSLERHRAIRSAWRAIPVEHLASQRTLQFSMDPSTDPAWFSDFELSIYGTSSSLDVQDLDRPDNHYDIVICNHILEHVERDTDAFRELLRVLRPEGFLQISVPSPASQKRTNDWGYPKEEFHGHYRHYGIDIIERFAEAEPDAKLLYAKVKDSVTDIEDLVFFWSFSENTINQLRKWLDYKVVLMN